jgi:hypothetical protein
VIKPELTLTDKRRQSCFMCFMCYSLGMTRGTGANRLVSLLRCRPQPVTGGSTSALAKRVIDEGLRMASHRGVIFKGGPAGRRAALACGPEIWEVIAYLFEIDARGATALDAAAVAFAADPGRIAAAVRYYGDYPAEIDAEIAAADTAARRAEQAWRARPRLIA